VLDILLDAYKDIGEHFPLLERYKDLFHNDPSMADTLGSLYTNIMTFHRKVLRKFSGSCKFLVLDLHTTLLSGFTDDGM
jgi:hypothetical protein